jgi:hypothetical protein
MKMIIVMGILLLPCLVYADTKCKVDEFSDHYDASCVGDEKAVPATGHQGVTTPIPAQETVLAPSGTTTPAPAQETVATPSVVTSDSAPSTQADAPQTPVVHRQGRPPQSVRDDAKAMRNRVIDERLLQQQLTQ